MKEIEDEVTNTVDQRKMEKKENEKARRNTKAGREDQYCLRDFD